MADNKIEVKSTSKTVENEKSKQQEEELQSIKKKKAELANKKKTETKSVKEETKKEDTSSIDVEQLSESIKDIASTIGNGKKTKGYFNGLITGLIVGALLTSFLGLTVFKNQLSEMVNSKNSIDKYIDETFFGYTALDFQDAILGDAVEHQELIVYEQFVEITSTVTKAGLGNLKIFSKTKEITYTGSGIFTVDFSKIDKDHISVDTDNKTITITIEEPILQSVNIDYDKIKFEDTEKGLLALGDLKLTTEENNEIMKSVENEIRTKLLSEEVIKKSNEYGLDKTWNTFAPIVNAMDEDYTVDIIYN